MSIVEELDWLDVMFHGLIIGSKGSGFKRIKEETGATVEIKNGRCFVMGTQDEIEKAKDVILKKVHLNQAYENKRTSKMGEFGTVEGKKTTLQETVDVVSDSWESVDFLDPKYFGAIIGKQGSHIKGLEKQFGLRMRKDSDRDKIVMKGSEEAKANAKEWFQEFVARKEKNFPETKEQQRRKPRGNGVSVRKRTTSDNLCWQSIDFLSPKCFGQIVGKGGSNLRKLESNYDVLIKIDKDKLSIKGSDEAKERITEYLRQVDFSNKNFVGKRVIKRAFIVGLATEDKVKLSLARNCKNLDHCEITGFNSFDLDRSYLNTPGLEEALLHAFQIAKMSTTKNPNSICEILVHSGTIHYSIRPGEYEASKVINGVYERLTKDVLTFDKIESLPVIKKIIRYDFMISTPAPVTELRYKLYIQFNEKEENFRFISCEDAGVVQKLFENIKSGPGYFCNKKDVIAKFDIIDPRSNVTTRLNIDVYYPEDEHTFLVTKHMEVLNDDFFNKIDIENDGPEVKLYIPDLPENYSLQFYRRSVRNDYCFASTNILRTSSEIVLINDGSQCKEENLTDLFFVNEIINSLFQTNDWTVKEVVEYFEKVLKFSDNIMQYLL